MENDQVSLFPNFALGFVLVCTTPGCRNYHREYCDHLDHTTEVERVAAIRDIGNQPEDRCPCCDVIGSMRNYHDEE